MAQERPHFRQSYPRLSIVVKGVSIAVVVSATLFFFSVVFFPNAITWVMIAGYLLVLVMGLAAVVLVVGTLVQLRWFAKQGNVNKSERE